MDEDNQKKYWEKLTLWEKYKFLQSFKEYEEECRQRNRNRARFEISNNMAARTPIRR